MADFFRFLRQSKTRIQKQQPTVRKSQYNESLKTAKLIMEHSVSRSSMAAVYQQPPKMTTTTTTTMTSARKRISLLKRYNISGTCIHVSSEKWDETWKSCLQEQSNNCEGLVFINPNFAPNYYSPSSTFVCDYDSYNEYSSINIDSLPHIRNEQFDKWMKIMIQSSSCHISMHCCQVIEMLDRLGRRCPNVKRLSLHYYHLDGKLISYLRKYFPKLICINLENSIGLSGREFAKFGHLPNLLHLNLSGCDIYEQSLLAILDNCPMLQTLNISNNCSITGECLAHKTIRNLKRLNIKDCWRLTPERLIEMVKCGLINLLELICNNAINDHSLMAITVNCPNLVHLDISYEEFTYFDQSGRKCLSDDGFKAIGRLINLKVLRIRHIGRLTDESLDHIIRSCTNLLKLTINVRHRHKLTDSKAIRHIGHSCVNLCYFEAVHNHFIASNSIEQLSRLTQTLQALVLRGNDLIKDEDISMLIQKCINISYINLDGCPLIGENTLAVSVVHARKLPKDNRNRSSVFHISLVMTTVERSLLNSLSSEFPDNLRIRACDYRRNRVHYNEFDGHDVHEYSLKERFFPYFWYDYN